MLFNPAFISPRSISPPATTLPRNSSPIAAVHIAGRRCRNEEWRVKYISPVRPNANPAGTAGTIPPDARRPVRCPGTAPAPGRFLPMSKLLLHPERFLPKPAGCFAPGLQIPEGDCDGRPAPAAALLVGP